MIKINIFFYIHVKVEQEKHYWKYFDKICSFMVNWLILVKNFIFIPVAPKN